MATNSQPSGWVGWVYFAGMLMLISGFFQIFMGIVALAKNTVYLVTPEHLAVLNYTAWGWIHILIGVILLTAASSVLSGHWWGRIVGAIIASIAFLDNLAFLPSYPLWSISMMIVSGLVLYALLVRGGEAKVN